MRTSVGAATGAGTSTGIEYATTGETSINTALTGATTGAVGGLSSKPGRAPNGPRNISKVLPPEPAIAPLKAAANPSPASIKNQPRIAAEEASQNTAHEHPGLS